VLHPVITLKNLYFKFNTFGWRMSYRCHYIFINILKSVQTLRFCRPFQSFHSKFSRFIPRSNQIRLLPFIVSSVHSFTLAFDMWVTWQQQERRNLLLLQYVEAKIPWRSGSQPPYRENSTCRNAALPTEFDSLYVTCQTHPIGGDCSGGSCPGWRLS